VYIYNGSGWQQRGSVIYGDNDAISISADGTVLAVGAVGKNENDTGYVRVYGYDESQWQQIGNNINGSTAGDGFGWAISLNADGTILALGAPGYGMDSGQVRIYKYNGTEWQQIGNSIDGETSGDAFGYSVSLSDNGHVIAIGAPFNITGNQFVSAGHVDVYHYNGREWQQIGRDINGESVDDISGIAVSLSADGYTLAIGAPYNNDSGFGARHVRCFHLITESPSSAPTVSPSMAPIVSPSVSRTKQDNTGTAIILSMGMVTCGTIISILAFIN